MSSITIHGGIGLIGYLLLGLTVGVAYFAAMWRSAELFAAGKRVGLAIGLVVGRLSLILAILAPIAIRGGALPLLVTALGIVIARAIAMRRVRAMAP